MLYNLEFFYIFATENKSIKSPCLWDYKMINSSRAVDGRKCRSRIVRRGACR